MKLDRTGVSKILRVLALAVACVALPSFADDYADISQLLRANKFTEAMTLVESKLATKPADPQLRFLKGVVQRNQGKQPEAIATFTKLTQDYPELPEPYNNLAVLYAAQGQYDKARATLEMAIRTNPNYATAYENLGDVYARLASQSYNKALLLDNGNTAIPPKLTVLREMFKPAAGALTAVPSPAAAKPLAAASAGAPAH
jgi:tetratricopeptide (TPR) repeat protein